MRLKVPNDMPSHVLCVALCWMTLTATGLASAQGSTDETAEVRNILQQASEAADSGNSDGSTRVLNRGTTFAAGFSHSCVVLADGRVQCWGGNQNGQLGNGSTTDSFSWVPVTVSGITDAVAASGGGDHTCALLAEGTVQCWGENRFGQLGNGTLTKSAVPVPVNRIANATAVAVGWEHSCAVLADGRVQCWGLVELSDKTATVHMVPATVSGITSPVAIAGGGRHTCVVLADGTVQCWGENRFGQLGDGTQAKSSVPVPVRGIANATAVTAGREHTCALLADGRVQCWGVKMTDNGTGTVSLVPEPISGIANAVAIAGGHYHSCALLNNGRVRCWGNNSGGELGNGTTTASIVPVTVSAITNAVTVATGGCNYSCAVLADGRVRCWGHVHFETLGKGNMSESPTPVPVSGLANAVAVPGRVAQTGK